MAETFTWVWAHWKLSSPSLSNLLISRRFWNATALWEKVSLKLSMLFFFTDYWKSGCGCFCIFYCRFYLILGSYLRTCLYRFRYSVNWWSNATSHISRHFSLSSPHHVTVSMGIMEVCLRHMYFLRKLTVLCHLFTKSQNHIFSIYNFGRKLLLPSLALPEQS